VTSNLPTTRPPTPRAPLRERVRSAGLRCTSARLAVLEHLVEHRGPQTHAEVADALDHRGFDRATIYRNLIELSEAGILARVELGDHVWRFEFRERDSAGRHEESHPHFLCTSCGEVSCLADVTVVITPKGATPLSAGALGGREPDAGNPEIRANAAQAGRTSVTDIPRVTEVLLKGRCRNCVEPHAVPEPSRSQQVTAEPGRPS